MAQTVLIQITGEDNLSQAAQAASKSLAQLGGAIADAGSAGGGGGMFDKIASSMGNMATVAGGIIAANLFSKIADGIGSFVSTGIDAVGKSQQLEASLKSLMTANAMYAQSTQTVTVAQTKEIMSADELASKQADLTAKLATQQATYNEQSERIRQLTAQYGDQGLVVIKTKAQQEQLGIAMQKTQQELAGLTTTQTKYTDVTQTSWKQVMSMGAAQKLAAKDTQYLMDAIAKIAVVSPFETQDVESVTKYAVAAGMGAKQTEEFTKGFLDMAASVGIGSNELGFAADQLLQVKKVGKLTTIDLRQLRRMGIDVEKVLGVEMGMSVDEFNKKAAESPKVFDDLFAAMTKFSQNTFAGTSQAMAQSVKGIQSTLSDIFTIGARTFFRPLIDAVSPAMSEMVGKLSDFVLGGNLEQIGQQMADKIGGAFKVFKAFGFEGGMKVLGQQMENQLGPVIGQLSGYLTDQWNTTVIPAVQGWADSFWAWVQKIYPQIPTMLSGIFTGITNFLTNQWPTVLTTISGWADTFWTWVGPAVEGATTALQGLLVAVMAWASSGDAQASINAAGVALGQALTQALGLASGQSVKQSGVMVKLGTALLAAVGTAAMVLIEVGGQLVAGILAGILDSLGVKLKPATFNELGDILKGIATNIGTIASKVGESIIDGVLQGLKDNASKVLEYLKSLLGSQAIDTVMSAIRGGSPAMVFAPAGSSIAEGIAYGISRASGALPQALQQMLNLGMQTFSPGDMIGQAADMVEKRLDQLGTIGDDKIKGFILPHMKQALRSNIGAVLHGSAEDLKNVMMGAVANWQKAGFSGEQGKAPGAAVDAFTSAIMRLREEFPKLAQAQAQANLEKMFGGFGTLAGNAKSGFDQLTNQIAVLSSMLRQGVSSIDIGGKIMDAAEAQKYLNGLVAQQAGLQGQVMAMQKKAEGFQTLQQGVAGVNLLRQGANPNLNRDIGQAGSFMGALGNATLSGLIPALGGNAAQLLKLLLGGTGGQTYNNISLNVNSNSDQSSILQDFELLQSLIPSGT